MKQLMPSNTRKRGKRTRICIDCGSVAEVRVDNPGVRCRRCSGHIGGLAGGAVLAGRANRVKCSGCGVEFNRSASAVNGENFCSRSCQHRAGNVDRVCKQCGGAFQVYRSVVAGSSNASGNFCSRPCYNAWLLAGSPDKPHYIQIKGARRAAVMNGARCARCGTVDRLDLHHVIPRRVGGVDAGNMIPLCKSCHKIVECLTADAITQGCSLAALPARIAPELLYA